MKHIVYFLPVLTFLIFSCKNKAEKNIITGETKSGNDITGNYTISPLAQPGQGAYLSGKFIYPLDNKPTPQCHTTMETPFRVVSAFFAGTHEKNPDVGIRVS